MRVQKFNWKVLLVIGLTAGGIQVLTGVVMYLSGVYFLGWTIFVNYLVLLLCIILGTKWYRTKTPDDTITYTRALIVGIVISVSTGLIYALYNIISVSFFYPHFLEDMLRAQVARIQSLGLGPEQTAERVAAAKKHTTLPTIAVGNLLRLSLVGFVLSLFTSIILREKTSSDGPM
jgi:hypothetical protein